MTTVFAGGRPKWDLESRLAQEPPDPQPVH